MNWAGVADLMNKEFADVDKPYSEAAWRKPYQMAKKFYESGVFNNLSEDKYFKELQLQKNEVYKEKRRLYDQRREYNKLLTSDARSEHLIEEMIQSANKLNEKQPLVFEEKWFKPNIHREAVMFWSDWHYGMITDNIWNTYNTDICRKRVKLFIEITKDFIQLNNIDVLNIVTLGDAAHGSIHTGCRVQSEEDTCDQLMHVAEIMAEAINDLSKCVNHIALYSCYGNHLRTIQKKRTLSIVITWKKLFLGGLRNVYRIIQKLKLLNRNTKNLLN